MTSANLQTYLKLVEAAEIESDLTSERSKAAMLEHFTPDFEVIEPPSLPEGYGGVHRGLDSWLEMQEVMRSHWRQRMTVERMWDLPDDDLVVLYSVMEWTGNRTGKSTTFPTVERLWFRDAKIARVEMFFQDTKVILDTLEEA